MSVICLIGNKHGAGKSMLAVNLASALARSAPTILFDADPRHAALNWCLNRQLDPRQRISSLTKSSLSEIDLSATDTIIRHRPVFNHSLKRGRSVLEMGSTGRTASAEIQQLINEVLPDEKFHYQ